MERVVLSVVLVTGLALGSACSFNAEGIGVISVDAQPDGPGDPDGRVDAPPDGLVGEAIPDTWTDLPLKDLVPDQPILDIIPPDAAILCSSWTPAPKHFNPCNVGAPKKGLSLITAGVWIYNTDTGWLTDPNNAGTQPQSKLLTLGGVTARVLSVSSFTLDNGVTLRAKGNYPLVVAVWYSATVDGDIDVSSKRDLLTGVQNLGAGANPSACSTEAPTAGQKNSSLGGGGGGGGLGSDGGDGGDGDNGNAAKGAKGSAVAAPGTTVRGGCAGAKGGASGGGSGGWGGGAVQITARVAITIKGLLHAGAASGDGGAVLTSGGGGGGGSGGYLGLEAPTVTLFSSAILAANGGGGGGGASSYFLGFKGANGQPSASYAAGGVGAGAGLSGGNGGTGGYKGKLAGQVGKSASGGGGGGGGGVGHLVISSSNYNNNNAVISAKSKLP